VFGPASMLSVSDEDVTSPSSSDTAESLVRKTCVAPGAVRPG